MSEKLLNNNARNRFNMTNPATRTTTKKYGTQIGLATYKQSHIDSIHSPQSTRKTIKKLKMEMKVCEYCIICQIFKRVKEKS